MVRRPAGTVPTMSAETWAVHAVESTNPKYNNATYTTDEITEGDREGWFRVLLDVEDGNSEVIAEFSVDGLTDDGCLDEIDRQIAAAGYPPRGGVVIAP